jgi:phage terminase small subunit
MQAMLTLRNPRHEHFSQLLASGKSATDAYELAGYRRSHSNGPALARDDEISTRVAQINAARWDRERAAAASAAERAVVTVESLIAEAEEARVAAMAYGQIGAAVAAIKEKGVLSGKRIERSERGEPGGFDWMERASELELVAFIDHGIVPDAGKLN